MWKSDNESYDYVSRITMFMFWSAKRQQHCGLDVGNYCQMGFVNSSVGIFVQQTRWNNTALFWDLCFTVILRFKCISPLNYNKNTTTASRLSVIDLNLTIHFMDFIIYWHYQLVQLVLNNLHGLQIIPINGNFHSRICNSHFTMTESNERSLHTITVTHKHPFNSPFPGLPRWAGTSLDFTEAKDSEWQWHQLGHMPVCTSLQTDNHASTPPLSFYRPDALPAAQPTASKHWRHTITVKTMKNSKKR